LPRTQRLDFFAIHKKERLRGSPEFQRPPGSVWLSGYRTNDCPELCQTAPVLRLLGLL